MLSEMAFDEIKKLYQAAPLTIDVPLIIGVKESRNGARPRKRKR
jgi:hypothetical protein